MDDQIRSLIEREAVIGTVTDLFVATDERDWAGLRQCLAPQVRFDMSSLSGEAPARLAADQIIDAWDAGLRPLQAVHHQAGNYRIEVTGSEAEARCYGIAYHYLPNPAGSTRVFVGSYEFHLLKIDGAWRIDGFKFNLKFIDGNLELEKA